MADPCFRYELDINTLDWVKNEINITLDHALQALKSYQDSPEEDSQIKVCQNYLHQIQGTLKMVELYGAALVVEELEKLTYALSRNKVPNNEEACQVLIKVMVQLPVFFDHIQTGSADIPIILLPLLNDMRAARNENLLTENALFSPNIAVSAPEKVFDKNNDVQSLAKKLRHPCHIGMLHWFKDKKIDSGINQVSKVMTKLYKTSNDSEVNKMLWITSGVLEALNEGGLESSIAIKLLIGNVDREIKRLIDNGESEFSNEIPTTLLKNLLYYISYSTSNGELVKEIKKTFNLKNIAPNIKLPENTNTDITAPTASLIQTASSELIKELTQIIDNLALFSRSENRDAKQLIPSSLILSKMSDTLGFLGLGIQRTTIFEQKNHIDSIINNKNEIDDYAVMDIAESLLSVKDSLTDLCKLTSNRFNIDTVTINLHDLEKEKLVNLLVSEANNDLYKIKKSLSAYSCTPENYSLLIDIPNSLLKIQEKLSELSLDRASQLLSHLNKYIQNDLINDKRIPELQALDNLADTISGIEYYLESLVENWGQSDSILLFAEQSLQEFTQNYTIFDNLNSAAAYN